VAHSRLAVIVRPLFINFSSMLPPFSFRCTPQECMQPKTFYRILDGVLSPNTPLPSRLLWKVAVTLLQVEWPHLPSSSFSDSLVSGASFR